MPEMPNSYISIPYNNVDFVISSDYVLETRPCNSTEYALDSIDWSLSKKINFSSSQIPFIPFDLIAQLFDNNHADFYQKIKSSNVKTAIIIKNKKDSGFFEGEESFALITSANCRLLDFENQKFVKNSGLVESLFPKLGIEFSSFFEGRFSPVINPFVFLEKMRGCV